MTNNGLILEIAALLDHRLSFEAISKYYNDASTYYGLGFTERVQGIMDDIKALDDREQQTILSGAYRVIQADDLKFDVGVSMGIYQQRRKDLIAQLKGLLGINGDTLGATRSNWSITRVRRA